MALSKLRSASFEDTAIHGNRNLIINGAMQVAQRGTVTGVTNGYGGPDRAKYIKNGAAIVTLSQDTDVPSGQGFTSSMKFDVTTADSSIAAGEYALIQHFIEAQNLQHLKYGTTDAVKCTIQFWVKSPKTGTHIFEVVHDDAAYYNAHQYTISTANTWQKVEITFDGYQPTAINNDNGIGLQINWWLAAGSTFSGGTYNENTWHNTVANRAVGQVNAVDSTSNNFYLTGIQLEVGEQATPFEHRSYADELSSCQRYFQRWKGATQGRALGQGMMYGTNLALGMFNYKKTMRTTPTASVTAANTIIAYYVGAVLTANDTAPFDNMGDSTARFNLATTSSTTNGRGLHFFITNSTDSLDLDAEL